MVCIPLHQSVCAYLGLDPGGIVAGQLLLAGGGDQDVTVGLQDAALVWLGPGEAHNGAVLLHTHTHTHTHTNK